mmetsp:Transcript_112811/g.329666  ORF Transcript_112811/g.329666 Transcript_112811/m.329666 type:complete len:354 (-) Transcript_112811:973-2034(-)
MDGSVVVPLVSRWRLRSRVLVAVTAFCASCCVEPAFSQAAFISSASRSTPPSTSAFVASVAVSSCFSTCTTFSDTSRFTVASFLSAMHFLASPSCLVTASNLVCISESWSVVILEDFSESRLAANRFMARKVFAPPTAACDAWSAASRLLSAALASSTVCSSGGFWKATSASETLPTASSASFTLASDSFSRVSTSIFSVRSFMVATVLSSMSCACFTRGCSFTISSLATPCTRVCVSTNLAMVFRATWASAAACSAAFGPLIADSSPSFFVSPSLASPSLASPSSASSVLGASGASVPSASTMAQTLATFSSAAFSLVCASSIVFFACRRCSTVAESFLYLPTSACAVLSLV